MIPILYEATEIVFTSNGLGRLCDCKKCNVKEVRNGEYVLTMEYPITGSLYSEIRIGRIIGAIHDDNHDVQPFVIYAHSKPLNGIVTFYANHLSYRLKNVVIKPFTASTCAAAIAAMKTKAYGENRFSFWTDKNVSATYQNQVPSACRSLLAGEENSLLDVYGTGEYEFDKWTVKLHLHRGTNRGVSVRYGVNMTELVQDVDYQDAYNAVAPYWTNAETGTTVTLPDGYIVVGEMQTTIVPWTDNNGAYITDNNGNIIEFNVPEIRVRPLNLSDQFESEPTEEQLINAAISVMNSSTPWLPSTNIKLSFVNQGSVFEPLQVVRLCDEISVYCGPIGVSATSMKVVSVNYDVLTERNIEVEVGMIKTNFADLIQKSTLSSAMAYAATVSASAQSAAESYADGVSASAQSAAQSYASQQVQTLDNTLTQQEIYDRLTDGGLEQGLALETAFNPGPSAAGEKKLYLNLDYARFGKLIADMIQGGTLTLGGASNVNGALQIKNASGTVIGSWDKDGLSATSGTFSGALNGATGTFSGTMSASGISGGTLTLGGANNTNGQIALKNSSNTQIGTWDNDKLKLGTNNDFVQLYGSASYNGVSAKTPFYAKQTYNNKSYEMMLKQGMLVLLQGVIGLQLLPDSISLAENSGEGYEPYIQIAKGYIDSLTGQDFEVSAENATLKLIGNYINLIGGVKVNGTTGKTGTFTSGSHTLTITNGIITKIT